MRVSEIRDFARNRRHRVTPQRRWQARRSATVMLSTSHGPSSRTCPTSVSPAAISRFNAARARRTLLARARATRCCGSGVVAVAVFCVIFGLLRVVFGWCRQPKLGLPKQRMVGASVRCAAELSASKPILRPVREQNVNVFKANRSRKARDGRRCALSGYSVPKRRSKSKVCGKAEAQAAGSGPCSASKLALTEANAPRARSIVSSS